MASRKADGTPDQTPDFTYIGDKQFSIDATTEQLKQQRVSAADVAARGASSDDGDSAPDAAVQKIKDAHDKAADGAAADAESEVNGRQEETTSRSTATRRTTAVENTSANPAK
ncbi:MAG: hypothetical protein ABIS21_01050 [Acidimicrobiales bacterium]